MEGMEGLDEDMKQAIKIAAMADAADEELEDGKEESDIFLNTKDLKEAMAGLGGDDEEESKFESKATKKLKEKKEKKSK